MKARRDDRNERADDTQRDFVALGIAAAAIILFVGTGVAVLPRIVRAYQGLGGGPDEILVSALLLNIALLLLGWRRYRELQCEIDDRRRAAEAAEALARIDPLTGCLNRRSLVAATQDMLGQAHEGDKAVAFLMIDLDNFKAINDLNGHQVGDEILQSVADRLGDNLPDNALISRLGGDEFACVIPYSKTRTATIDRIAEQLILALSEPATVNRIPVDMTVSLGITSSAELDDHGPDCSDTQMLMHRADIAMYQAKKQGKNRYFWFEPPMESELRFRNGLETGIRQGIANGEFVPYYEQQIDLETGEIVGFEMLARWDSPDMGLVTPDVFIPIAEEMGVIGKLSETLIAQAFTDAKEWDPKLTLSVNISPYQLRDPWFSQKLLKLIVAHNFPAERLEIELTEACLHENVGMVRSMVESLRNQGVRISLDDFGTGYSSLSQLRSLPFDRLKIDRNFVRDLSNDDPTAKIVEAIINLGGGLNLPITAEGIEDESILSVLKTFGPLKGQGYFYGKPEPAGAVRKRLADDGRLMPLHTRNSERFEPMDDTPEPAKKQVR